MTFRITRHVRVTVPTVFKQESSKEVATKPVEESKGLKRIAQKSIFMVPVVSLGSTLSVAAFAQTSLSFLGSANILGLFLLGLVTSMTTLFIVPGMIKHSMNNGSMKYFPGKASLKSINQKKPSTIEPFADWDNVFLPYVVEAFNGVSVKDENGQNRKPVKLHTNHYVELRTKPRTQNIDYSMVEAQQF